ncbi:UPF0711 protein C18orf21 homolog [Danio aesculapii]|uniref:UPF0711 protein C18orf21 homolog n=1 Tax=Danio aesculapii TaxID=1142201 RepID=UPI0024C02019|nr:UPF0711 protein C18orf21 homolog [Danio aesculapii]
MTHNFLLKASLLYKDICPEQSRFLLQRHQSTAAALPQSIICPFCFEWRTLGNHHVRLRPKRKPTAGIRRLLKRESAGKRLSAEQTAVLQKFKRASNALFRALARFALTIQAYRTKSQVNRALTRLFLPGQGRTNAIRDREIWVSEGELDQDVTQVRLRLDIP